MAQDLQDWLTAGGFLVTVVLFALSTSAYRATRDRRLLAVTAAFLLWTLRLGLNAAASFLVPAWEGSTALELGGSVLDLVVPAVFFLALVPRDRPAD